MAVPKNKKSKRKSRSIKIKLNIKNKFIVKNYFYNLHSKHRCLI
ncbi:hypothetical protein [Candidatus Carsonella ruddii]|uniref:Ribosomal protein L32 n=1 Tax=Candidatus Carsonella ruddii CE isolate Thao2000 TaxID=1202536 RepID=J7GW05_CARRU|nr:hypothetical protein [Candidatus Carsonella ruddii]AFP83581.1 ribosomal protein L32 [Candidatus Carsonella ruddii CE isolate Thao2000]